MALHRKASHAGVRTALALSCLVLTACGNDVHGSPEPPAEFGAKARSLLGCPSLQGVYAWPPVAGEYAQGKIPSNRTPWDGGMPVRIHGQEMQIWVQQPAGGQTLMRTRLVNRAKNVRTRLTREWGLATYNGSQVRCTSSMLEMEPGDTQAPNHYGGTGMRRGFRLALMKDGALAVGIHTITYGHTGSYFSWGGQSYGNYKASDVEYWSWSKLARLESGDKEPAPIDAYVPGATAP